MLAFCVLLSRAYRAFRDWVGTNGPWVLEIVTKRPGQATFVVPPKRWIVERTFGWFNRYRRLSKDDERNPTSSEAWVHIAMIHRMSRFTFPDQNRDDDLLWRPRKRRQT